MVDILRWKMSFDGSHLCLKTTFDGRQPSMEDDLQYTDNDSNTDTDTDTHTSTNTDTDN